ncbi:hypothetical protein [Streptomyces sp. NPDC096351]|uniref:hypothetical protein n=1 Tax=Streptomyces sp. NPDC096351 TaxID=3366087 RepID=UPI00382FFB5B
MSTAPSPLQFPLGLKNLQADLHRAHAEYQALCRSLPWSVEPLPGWEAKINPNTEEIITPGREASPGYTPEQVAEEKRLWDTVRELSIALSTHPFWAGLEQGPARVDARMALKNHEDVLAAVTATAAADAGKDDVAQAA